jgi:transmembrane 9 superfamily protein 2/4
MSNLAVFALLFLSISDRGAAVYYLPGVTPHTYQLRDPVRSENKKYNSCQCLIFQNNNYQVKLYVSKLTSTKTQIPYDYYSLPYCKPEVAGLQAENLGEVISGDRIENSVFKVWVSMS